MSWLTAIFTYFVIWWLVLFTTLPFGIEHEERHEAGHMPGAPKHHHMKKKLVATSVITALLWIIVYIIMDSGVIDFYDAARKMAVEDSLK